MRTFPARLFWFLTGLGKSEEMLGQLLREHGKAGLDRRRAMACSPISAGWTLAKVYDQFMAKNASNSASVLGKGWKGDLTI